MKKLRRVLSFLSAAFLLIGVTIISQTMASADVTSSFQGADSGGTFNIPFTLTLASGSSSTNWPSFEINFPAGQTVNSCGYDSNGVLGYTVGPQACAWADTIYYEQQVSVSINVTDDGTCGYQGQGYVTAQTEFLTGI